MYEKQDFLNVVTKIRCSECLDVNLLFQSFRYCCATTWGAYQDFRVGFYVV